MAFAIQITIDSTNPHAQADWWAETLDWIVEPTDQAFVDRMLEAGYARPDELLQHGGTRVWKAGAAICRAEDVGRKGRQRILFQPVPEAKSTKNRVHVDINLDGEDKDALRASLEARSARFIHAGSQGPHTWYTMADPEGNEFCLG
ncbi:VOC family protein [Arthrobacter sp. Br18]|uniref:VOC family protein n=1 Tax=Arthrobacter sp. Br18 TaxID=1312954 RepID=UPI000479DEF2|nr:VOC family protein [Arthrobacter sp. Br18]